MAPRRIPTIFALRPAPTALSLAELYQGWRLRTRGHALTDDDSASEHIYYTPGVGSRNCSQGHQPFAKLEEVLEELDCADDKVSFLVVTPAVGVTDARWRSSWSLH